MSLKQACEEVGCPYHDVCTLKYVSIPVMAEYRTIRAKKGDSMIDECYEILDDRSHDVLESEDAHGGIKRSANMAAVKRDTERVNFRKWLAGRFNPDYAQTPLVQVDNRQVHVHNALDVSPEALDHMTLEDVIANVRKLARGTG